MSHFLHFNEGKKSLKHYKINTSPHLCKYGKVLSTNIKNAIYLAIAALVAVPGLYYATDYIQFHQHMLGLGIEDSGSHCDSACAGERMTDRYYRYEEGYACVEVSPDRYVCRPPRGADDRTKEGYQSMQVAIPNVSYGEIFVVPTDGSGRGAYHVGEVALVDESTERIRVNFYAPTIDDGWGDVIHVAEMIPGDTYVQCYLEWQNVFHLVEYTGTFDLNGTMMADFWAAHIGPRPPELFPCDPKKIISRSLEIDYDLGLPPYEEFERVFLEKKSWGHNLGP